MTEKTPAEGRSSKRGGGLRALGATLPKVTGRLFGRRGFAEGGLIADWPEIVGQELAAVSLPRRLSFPRRDLRRDGTLTLRVALGHALTLQHLEPVILERINGYMGYGAVARLRLRQGPLGTPGREPKRLVAAPDPADEARLSARLADIEDEALRAALGRLGRAVLAEPDAD